MGDEAARHGRENGDIVIELRAMLVSCGLLLVGCPSSLPDWRSGSPATSSSAVAPVAEGGTIDAPEDPPTSMATEEEHGHAHH